MERLKDDMFLRRAKEGAVTVSYTGKLHKWLDLGLKHVVLGDLLTNPGPTTVEQLSGHQRWSKYTQRYGKVK